MTETFANDAQTTINQAGGIGSGDVSFTVSSASDFPTSGEFRIRIDDELMLVTNVAGNVFTVTRAIESTAATAHGNGAYVTAILTAGALAAFSGSVIRVMSFDALKGVATDDTGIPTVIGACYIDPLKVPNLPLMAWKFRCVLQSTDANVIYKAVADLFDVDNVLGGGPGPVAGSQIDNVGTPNPIVAGMAESDITAAMSGLFAAGTFEARLWIDTPGGGNFVACKSAQIIVEW